jgi:glycerophosphoryl diester phosphodiesterase
MKIIAHRGYSAEAPENTLAAFNLAFDVSSDGIELDVYLTKDQKIAVMHDATTARTGDRDLSVVDSGIEELKKLDVGAWKGEKWAGERVPELSEVFDCIPAGKEIVIELKSGSEILPVLGEYIRKSGKKEKEIVLISFNDSIFAAKKLFPKIKTLLLYSNTDDISEIINKAVDRGMEGLDLAWKGLTQEKIKLVKDAGLKLYVWTVDDVKVARQMKEYGVDGLTTNNPEIMGIENEK